MNVKKQKNAFHGTRAKDAGNDLDFESIIRTCPHLTRSAAALEAASAATAAAAAPCANRVAAEEAALSSGSTGTA